MDIPDAILQQDVNDIERVLLVEKIDPNHIQYKLLIGGSISNRLRLRFSNTTGDLIDSEYVNNTTLSNIRDYISADRVLYFGGSGGGSSEFTKLIDTPDTLVANKYVRVNSTGDALELGDVSTTFLDLTDTPDTLLAGKYLQVNTSGDALQLTDLPDNTFVNLSDTPTTLQAGKSLRVNSTGDALELVDMNLSDLQDVDTTSAGHVPADGDVLYWNASMGHWMPQTIEDSSFQDLSNTPAGLTANKYLRVSSDATAIEFADISTSFVGLTDTPSALNAGRYLTVNNDGTRVIQSTVAPPNGGAGGSMTIQQVSKLDFKIPDAVIVQIDNTTSGFQIPLYYVSSTKIQYRLVNSPSDGHTGFRVTFANDGDTGANLGQSETNYASGTRMDSEYVASSLKQFVENGWVVYHGQASGTSGVGALNMVKQELSNFLYQLPDSIINKRADGYIGVYDLKWVRKETTSDNGNNIYYQIRDDGGGGGSDFGFIFKDDPAGTFIRLQDGNTSSYWNTDNPLPTSLQQLIQDGDVLYTGSTPKTSRIGQLQHVRDLVPLAESVDLPDAIISEDSDHAGTWRVMLVEKITDEHVQYIDGNTLDYIRFDSTTGLVLERQGVKNHFDNITQCIVGGYALFYGGAGSGGESGASTFTQLLDTPDTLTAGKFLKISDDASVVELSDIQITTENITNIDSSSPQDKQVLAWDTAADAYINIGMDAIQNASSLESLTDTNLDTSSLTTGAALVWNADDSAWIAEQPVVDKAFVELTDTPNTLKSKSYLRVNGDGTKIEQIKTAPPDGGLGDNSAIQATSNFDGKLPDQLIIKHTTPAGSESSDSYGGYIVCELRQVSVNKIIYTDTWADGAYRIVFNNNPAGDGWSVAGFGGGAHILSPIDGVPAPTIQQLIDNGYAIFHGQQSGTSGAGNLSVIKVKAEEFYTELPDAIVATTGDGFESILRLKFMNSITGRSNGENFWYEARIDTTSGSNSDYLIIFKDDADGTFMGHHHQADHWPTDGSMDQDLRWFIENGRALYFGSQPQTSRIGQLEETRNTIPLASSLEIPDAILGKDHNGNLRVFKITQVKSHLFDYQANTDGDNWYHGFDSTTGAWLTGHNSNATKEFDSIQEYIANGRALYYGGTSSGTGATSFVGLDDTPETLEPNKVLKTDATGENVILVDDDPQISSIGDIQDVDTTSAGHVPADGDTLVWNDTHGHWMPGSGTSSFTDLTDTTTTLASGGYLRVSPDGQLISSTVNAPHHSGGVGQTIAAMENKTGLVIPDKVYFPYGSSGTNGLGYNLYAVDFYRATSSNIYYRGVAGSSSTYFQIAFSNEPGGPNLGSSTSKYVGASSQSSRDPRAYLWSLQEFIDNGHVVYSGDAAGTTGVGKVDAIRRQVKNFVHELPDAIVAVDESGREIVLDLRLVERDDQNVNSVNYDFVYRAWVEGADFAIYFDDTTDGDVNAYQTTNSSLALNNATQSLSWYIQNGRAIYRGSFKNTTRVGNNPVIRDLIPVSQHVDIPDSLVVEYTNGTKRIVNFIQAESPSANYFQYQSNTRDVNVVIAFDKDTGAVDQTSTHTQNVNVEFPTLQQYISNDRALYNGTDSEINRFTSLIDTPNTMEPGSYLQVNARGDGILATPTPPSDGGVGDNSEIHLASEFAGKIPDAILLKHSDNRPVVHILRYIGSGVIQFVEPQNSGLAHFTNDSVGSRNGGSSAGGNTSFVPYEGVNASLQDIIDGGHAIYHGQRSGTNGAGANSGIKAHANTSANGGFYTELPDAIWGGINDTYTGIARLHWVKPNTNARGTNTGDHSTWEVIYRVESLDSGDYFYGFFLDNDGTPSGSSKVGRNTDWTLREFIENGHALYNSQPAFGVKAWCTFDGTGGNGVKSHTGDNIQSVERVSTGLYKITMKHPAPHADYSISGTANPWGYNGAYVGIRNTYNGVTAYSPTTTTFHAEVRQYSNAGTDSNRISIQVTY